MKNTICWRPLKLLITPAVEVVAKLALAANCAISVVVVVLVIDAG
jgi:hypothetical protein